ncbi:isopentenyl-diphosphate Delta-isomerase [Dyadobacter sandarakinus]|uniref:Isopentenyl-diphosphate delta-isomerase n=1 Tax=Dyadobacter sandarakinus TaxID=2747268 RepID=A0ABX7I532_9BACT|nr:isopentenyl-diphosphate Delta-isomerase [Dyadobacter sandarakinus]QRR00968.1 isopentenyl-diphosphate Delta-isomerase [Dyadobacter sandarakinus]
MSDQVVLVNEEDEAIGLMPKLEAHQKGVLHRAFSVFVFNSKGEMLLQRRAFGKYHSEGLWSNTCCSHPLDGETTYLGAVRRLREEMGITAELNFLFTFQYRASLENGLTEHELDHVFWGVTDDLPELNPEEASDFRYLTTSEIRADVAANPGAYTEWFKICLSEVLDKIPLP